MTDQSSYQWVSCLKCLSSFNTFYLAGKNIRHCPMCSEPNLRVIDKHGMPTELIWDGVLREGVK